MDEDIIKTALGKKPDLTPKKKLYSYIKYFSLPVGKKVLMVDDYSDILKNEDVVFAHVAVKKDDVIEEITESKKRPGFVIVKGKDREETIHRVDACTEKILSRIKIGE